MLEPEGRRPLRDINNQTVTQRPSAGLLIAVKKLLPVNNHLTGRRSFAIKYFLSFVRCALSGIADPQVVVKQAEANCVNGRLIFGPCIYCSARQICIGLRELCVDRLLTRNSTDVK